MRIRTGRASDLRPLEGLLSRIENFTPEEVACAVELLELVAAAARERPRREHRKFVRTRTRASARRSRLRRAGWRKDAEHVDYKLLVAEADGALAGYVLYGPTPMTEATWDLYWIASDPAFRGKGAGSLLVLAMEDEILRRRGRHVRIETSSLGEYASTRAFYDRHRYLEASRLPDFYKPGDDLVTLYKRLG